MANKELTTGQGLAIMNAALKDAPQGSAKNLRRLRGHLVRKWLRDGLPIQYTSERVANAVRCGVPVSPHKLLTDQPHLLPSIACGAVSGYILADESHPASLWLVQVAGVRYLTADGSAARALYLWAMERKRAQLKSLKECEVK